TPLARSICSRRTRISSTERRQAFVVSPSPAVTDMVASLRIHARNVQDGGDRTPLSHPRTTPRPGSRRPKGAGTRARKDSWLQAGPDAPLDAVDRACEDADDDLLSEMRRSRTWHRSRP